MRPGAVEENPSSTVHIPFRIAALRIDVFMRPHLFSPRAMKIDSLLFDAPTTEYG